MARSRQITGAIGHLSRSQVKEKRGLHKGQKKSAAPEKAAPAPHTEKQIGGDNNGQTRLVPTSKASRFYPAEDARVPKKSRKRTNKTVLKKGLTPGSIVILLAGRYAGKRVVFLKQLDSGLLLVTGPFKLNGVPLRRVNQAYVIATSTKVDLGDFKVRFPCYSNVLMALITYPDRRQNQRHLLRQGQVRIEKIEGGGVLCRG